MDAALPGDGIGSPTGTRNRHCRLLSFHTRSSLLQVEADRSPEAAKLVMKEGWWPRTPHCWQLLASQSCKADTTTTRADTTGTTLVQK